MHYAHPHTTPFYQSKHICEVSSSLLILQFLKSKIEICNNFLKSKPANVLHSVRPRPLFWFRYRYRNRNPNWLILWADTITFQNPRNTRKTRTQKFGCGSGRVLLNKISGFLGHIWENPKNSSLVEFWVFSGFCTL